MSDETSGRLTRPTPPAFLRIVVNPVMRAVLKSPVSGPLGRSLGVLTFLGRRTGTRYRVVIGYREAGDVVRVWSNAGWRVNFRGDEGHPAALRLAGRDRLVTGRLVEDEDTVVAEAYAYLSGGGDPRRMGLRLEGDGPVTEADVRALVPPLSILEFRPRSAAE